MIKYIHKKASIFIFQFISFITQSIYYTAINLYTTQMNIIQGNSQYHWGALTPDYY